MKAMGLKRFTLIVGLGLLAVRGYADPVAVCVSSTNDAGAGSLREAIEQANAAGEGAITFCFPVGTTNTITLLTPLPSLAANITITGPGTNQLIVSGGNQCWIFRMNSGTTNTLSGLTIADGRAVGHPSVQGGPSAMTNASGIANFGSLMVLDCVVRNCRNTGTEGNGIYNAGDLTMENSTVADCRSLYHPDNTVVGGGIFNKGNLQVSGCRISNCSAYWGGGIQNQSNLTMTASVLASCWATGETGGGINSTLASGVTVTTLTSCLISNCSAGWGGGIHGGGVAMTNCTVFGGSANEGAGLELFGTNFMVNCTVMRNNAYYGSGICNSGAGELHLIGCTISDNLGSSGAAIFNGTGYSGNTNMVLYLDSCTIVSNIPGTSLGVVYAPKGKLYSRNSIFAGNSNDFSGQLISQGYNLIQNTNGCTIVGDVTGNRLGVDPLVGPLQNNGGPTWTHALLPGSPAIDHGNSAGVLTDQRGVARLFDDAAISNEAGDGSDIGAYESGSLPTATMLPIAAAPGGLAVRFSGINGYTYSVQRAVAVGGPWETLSPASVGPNGVGSFVDPNPPTAGAFYRTAFP